MAAVVAAVLAVVARLELRVVAAELVTLVVGQN
jgi:hypothetical protein